MKKVTDHIWNEVATQVGNQISQVSREIENQVNDSIIKYEGYRILQKKSAFFIQYKKGGKWKFYRHGYDLLFGKIAYATLESAQRNLKNRIEYEKLPNEKIHPFIN